MDSQAGAAVIVLDGSHVPDKEVVGGKAWSLARMRSLGLRVPPAFVIPVPQCRGYLEAGRSLSPEVWEGVLEGVRELERSTGRRLGDATVPLLVSVRSGAAVSMPGMMDTVLNLGMTDEVERALAHTAKDDAYARDTRARFCHAFGDIVLKADLDPYAAGQTTEAICAEVEATTSRTIPTDPYEQLRDAISAVFDSWQTSRAKAYRRHWGISDEGGTAVTVQAMVFGNLDERSGTGVLFTRNPLNGAHEPYGEWLPGGQGDDVVGGTHAVRSLAQMRAQLPEVVDELLSWAEALEREHAEVQDIEFTVEAGTVYLLQTRAAKRSPAAAVRIAIDLCDEGLLDRPAALTRVTAEQVRSVLMPVLDAEVAGGAELLASGEPACPGIAQGIGVQDPDEAARRAEAGERVVLVRPTTSPNDVHGMIAAVAVVTELGGSTSHAAVVTRALGRPSVVGTGAGSVQDLVGREITVDGTAGKVYPGLLPLVEKHVEDDEALSRLAGWAAEVSPVQVVPEAPEGVDVIDLDPLLVPAPDAPVADEDAVVRALSGARAARGAVFMTDSGACAAHRTGITVVADCPLLVHLTVLRALGIDAKG